jgi:hypothetical protein
VGNQTMVPGYECSTATQFSCWAPAFPTQSAKSTSITVTGCGSAVLFTASAIAGVPLDMSGVNHLMYSMDTKHTRGIETTFQGQKWLNYHSEALAFNISFSDPQYKLRTTFNGWPALLPL